MQKFHINESFTIHQHQQFYECVHSSKITIQWSEKIRFFLLKFRMRRVTMTNY